MKLNQFWNDLLTKGAILGGIMVASHCFEQCAIIYGGTMAWVKVLGFEWLVIAALYIYLMFRFTKSYAANVMEQQGEVKVFTYGNGLSYMVAVSILVGTMVGVGGYILRHFVIGYTEYITLNAKAMVEIVKSSPEASAMVGDMNQLVNQIMQQAEPSIFSTIASSIWSYILVGLVVGLILAAFTKHTPKLFDTIDDNNNTKEE